MPQRFYSFLPFFSCISFVSPFVVVQTFQTFLDWFRSEFPYFHDECDSCGASCKDDPPESQRSEKDVGNAADKVQIPHRGGETTNGQADETQPINIVDIIDDDDDYNNNNDFSFLGYVHPTPAELLGNATRTELYRCRSCSSYTRFPRFNKALWVTSARRGRCGEYSMLLYRMLRVLGYGEVRWVVDWADHVWVEVWLGEENNNNGRWVHLDPCEAAVDNPLLYESWGKNQTYIVAFHDPFYDRFRSTGSVMERSGGAFPSSVPITRQNSLLAPSLEKQKQEALLQQFRFPPVEDITRRYTSDEAHVIQERRGIADEPVAEAIDEVSRNMVQLLQRMMQR